MARRLFLAITAASAAFSTASAQTTDPGRAASAPSLG